MTELDSRWPVDDETTFPKDFFDIGEKTFSWVYENRHEFRTYILEIQKATGLWKAFQEYVRMKSGSVRE